MMKLSEIKTRFSLLEAPLWSVPLVLLVILILGFGLLLPWLGYGYDEWYFIYYSTRGSEGLSEVFNYDGHPQAIWAFAQGFKLLGYEPFGWHITSLFWRWLAVSVFWWCFHLTWPEKRLQTLGAALLFAVYPFFTLQALPISYFEAWMSFFILGMSFVFSLLALRYPAHSRLFTALAILFKVGHVFTREYTWFTELMRPALLWFALPDGLTWRKKAHRTAAAWMPYLLIFLAAVLWRGFLYQSTRETFQVQDGIFSNPFAFVLSWLLYVIPDAVLILLTSWYKLVSPEYFWLADRLNLALVGLALLVFIGLYLYLQKIRSSNTERRQEKRWAWQSLLLGLMVVLTGVLPFYIAGYAIYPSETPINARFALGLLPGAALFVVAVLELLVTSRRAQLAVLALLVAFSISWHLRYTYEASELWDRQSEFFRQFAWRVPGIQPGTTIHSPQPFTETPDSPAKVLVNGDFSYALAFNALYQSAPRDERLSYWYLSEGYDQADEGIPLETGHATTTFNGIPGRDLYVYLAPGECLRILKPSDADYRHFPDGVRAAAEHASLTAIDSSQPANTELIQTILDTDNGEGRWCYYYQKAELARQFADWDEVVELWLQSAGRGLQPEHGMDLLPFIEGHARSGDLETALTLTKRADHLSEAMNSVICSLWRGMAQDLDNGAAVFEQVRDKYGCAP